MQRIGLGLDCPTGWLEKVQLLADYDYVLVDKALADKTYLNYFKNSNRPKILNNRVLLEWEPLPLDRIKEVWDILGGAVISPDWMWESSKTFGSYEECCRTFREENVIGVVQGVTLGDIDICLRLYGEKVALPFDIGSKKEESYRVKMGRRIAMVNVLEGRKKIHLLGLTNPKELEFYKDSYSVESLNTGLPILLASQGKKLEYFDEDKKDSSYHGLDMDFPTIDFDLVKENISYLKEHLK
jgi:hypothetical protein